LGRVENAKKGDAAPSAKYKAALSVAYGAGLRASEDRNAGIVFCDLRARINL
jgi:hypothetical protein